MQRTTDGGGAPGPTEQARPGGGRVGLRRAENGREVNVAIDEAGRDVCPVGIDVPLWRPPRRRIGRRVDSDDDAVGNGDGCVDAPVRTVEIEDRPASDQEVAGCRLEHSTDSTASRNVRVKRYSATSAPKVE